MVAADISIVPEVASLISTTSAADNEVSDRVTFQSPSKPIAAMLVTALLTASAVLLVISVMLAALIFTEVLPFNVFKSAAEAEVASSTKVNASVALALPNAAFRVATAPVAVTVAVRLPVVSPMIVFALAAEAVSDKVTA